MDFVSPILDVAIRLWYSCAKRTKYIRHLEKNLISLKEEMKELKDLREDLERSVKLAEQQQMMRKKEVDGWLQTVQATETEVDQILKEGDEIQEKYLGKYPKKYWWRYKLGKRVIETLNGVTQLKNKGCFPVVAERLPRAPVDELPLEKTVGLESTYEKVCSCLKDEKGGTIALYGMPGVGKTTLLKKINNEFLKPSTDFDVVIWVAVSKQDTVSSTQDVIRNKLQIQDDIWRNRSEDEKAREIFNILKMKRFVLLLDDIWKRVDLSRVGVPFPQAESKSKVVITTRFMKVCREMEVQRRFRVECLAWEEALALFRKKVGEDTLNSHPDIPKLAEIVVEGCKGLPLALVTVGRAMTDRNTPQEWDQAIQELEKSPAEISGMQEEFFNVLKLSYDSLSDDITRSCFIYCSIFSEHHEIRNDELIEHWIGEGFLDDFADINEARRRGHKIIENLKHACLLEESNDFKDCIKMHDLVRDMALWISRECERRKHKILVYEGAEFVEAQAVAHWREAERISLCGKNIEILPETPSCPKLLTLFLRECTKLETFPMGFFQFMPHIRVLDLSATHQLTEFPVGIDALVNLEYLNLSMTHIKKLPAELVKLKKLRCLLLDSINPLVIPPHLILNLSSLQLFSMYNGDALSAEREALLEELESLEHMTEVSLSFCSTSSLNWLLQSHKLQSCIRRLGLYDCKDISLLELSSLSLRHLENLLMYSCPRLEDVKIIEKEGRKGFERGYFPNPYFIVTNNLHFCSLRDLKIWSCPKLVNLTWLIYAHCLESLSIQSCEAMEEVICNDYGATGSMGIFSRVTSLVLGGMPRLKSIYPRALLFPSLEAISVIACERLTRLPFDSNSAAKLKKIEGDQSWWDALQWEEETIKHTFSSLLPSLSMVFPFRLPAEPSQKEVSSSTSASRSVTHTIKKRKWHTSTAGQGQKLKGGD